MADLKPAFQRVPTDLNMPYEVREVFEQIARRWPDVVFTGSRAVGCPRPNSDWDFVVHDEWAIDLSEFSIDEDLAASLTKRDVLVGESGINKFTSVRIGDVNLIVDHRRDTLVNWAAATDYCTKHQVFDKSERIKVFDSFGAG